MKALSKTVRRYYKYTDSLWTQPTLTENGIMGRGAFAVTANANAGSSQPYLAFNGITTGNEGWESNSTTSAWIEFYNPNPLKVSQISVQNYYRVATIYKIESGSVEGSNDDINWTQLCTYTNSNFDNGAIWDITVNSADAYKYHRVNCQRASAGYMIIQEMGITATERIPQESTASDYDYYIDVDTYSVLNNGTYKAFN